jgi:hypothetical protein
VHHLNLLPILTRDWKNIFSNVKEIEDFQIVELVSSSPAVGTGCIIWGSGAEVAAQ